MNENLSNEFQKLLDSYLDARQRLAKFQEPHSYHTGDGQDELLHKLVAQKDVAARELLRLLISEDAVPTEAEIAADKKAYQEAFGPVAPQVKVVDNEKLMNELQSLSPIELEKALNKIGILDTDSGGTIGFQPLTDDEKEEIREELRKRKESSE